jgi:hypothetical protein
MTFRAYITLDNKYYSTLRNWQPLNPKLMTVRQLASGDMDITYAAKNLRVWEGDIIARVSENRAGYGISSDIETLLNSNAGIAFVDHYGTSVTVHVQSWKRKSALSDWAASANRFLYNVKLVADA